MKTLLLKQFDIAWQLTWYHLESLTTDECLWQPAAKGLHITKGSDGLWRGHLPDSESYDIGPTSIGWISWHLLFWWEMAFNHNFGDQTLQADQVIWPGTADGLRERVTEVKTKWVTRIERLDDAALNSQERCRWPFQGESLAVLLAWANVELTKNAAELGYVRFLYTQRNNG